MTTDQLTAKVDSLISGFESKFGKQVNSTQKALFDEMQVLLNKLELDSEGLIIQNQANRKVLAKVDEYFNRAFNQSGYYETLNGSANTIGNITGANSAYFNGIVEGFTPDAQYIKNLQNQTITQMEDLLANEGLDTMMKKPIIDIMNQNINTGASYKDLTAQMREFILGSDKLEPTLARYSKQITNDTLFNYSRALQESVSQNAGLQFYLYSGGVMDDSREFCIERHGKYYHKKEIEKWPKQTWQGKRRGTNSSNIFIYAGGYQCAHQIIAVSEAVVPKSVINRAKDLGYYE